MSPRGRHKPLSRRQLLTFAAAGGLSATTIGCVFDPYEGHSGERIVSLSPSTTEMVFALGAGALLVGRSSACNRPPEALNLPVVGGFGNPNMEVLLSLRPTLVVGSRGPAGPLLPQRLRQHGVEVLLPPTNSMPEVQQAISIIGARLSRQAEAAQVVGAMRRRVVQLQRWARGRPQPRTVMVFDANPTYVAGPGGFPDGLLRLAGARNVITGGGPYPVVSLEQLLRLDVQVVVDAIGIGRRGPSRLSQAPGWGVLAAVRQGRVRRLTSDAALRPGPRMAEGLAQLVQAVHGVAPS